MRMKHVVTMLACLIVGASACPCQGDTTVVATPAHKVILRRDIRWMSDSLLLLRFEPLPMYVFWKLEVEQCSGIRKDGFPLLFVAPIVPLPGQRLGIYVASSTTIVFALGYEREAWTVRHELLHWLLDPQDANEDQHPPKYFGDAQGRGGKCGDLVNEKPIK